MAEHHAGERGQILVLGALLMTVLFAFLALVIDVGNGYTQRRFVQNGSDAAAIAAARLLANNLDTGTSDASVAAVVGQYLEANGDGTFVPGAALTATEGAWYVTPGGTRIAAIGFGGTIPAAPMRGFPQLTGQSVGGVEIVGRKQFDTLFAGVLGYRQMTVRASGTAGFGGVSSVLLDWTQTGVPVAPLAFDVEAVTAQLGACGGYGATIQFDQYIDTPTECIFDRRRTTASRPSTSAAAAQRGRERHDRPSHRGPGVARQRRRGRRRNAHTGLPRRPQQPLRKVVWTWPPICGP